MKTLLWWPFVIAIFLICVLVCICTLYKYKCRQKIWSLNVVLSFSCTIPWIAVNKSRLVPPDPLSWRGRIWVRHCCCFLARCLDNETKMLSCYGILGCLFRYISKIWWSALTRSTLYSVVCRILKVHKHEIFLNFFLT